MKILYWLAIPLKWPFFIVGGLIMGVGWCFTAIGGILHDQIEYRFWLVLHKRWCKQRFPNS